MPEKKDRHQVIRMILSSQAIESQEELLAEMEIAGFPCNQATLSRDLKSMRISKVKDRRGRSAYALPAEQAFLPVPPRRELTDHLWHVQCTGRLMVLHTPPGHASMVAYDIDKARSPEFLGTVAGDDTIMIAIAEGIEHETAIAEIKRIVPKLGR